MERKEIQALLDFIAKSTLTDVTIETDAIKIKAKKTSGGVIFTPQSSEMSQTPLISSQITTEIQEKVETSPTTIIRSPMVGMFYASPNPESSPYIKQGDLIKKGQVVCIIEAMKLYNEIESDFSGKLMRILVEDKTPVEFDQPLFEIIE